MKVQITNVISGITVKQLANVFRELRNHITLCIASSSSFELFVVSFIQEDVFLGHTALALMLGLQVFS